MNYDEFKKEFMEQLKEKMKPENIRLQEEHIHKSNRDQEGIAIIFRNDPIAPMVYPEPLFEEYIKGTSFQKILVDVSNELKELHKNQITLPPFDRAEAEKRLYCVIMNAEWNKGLLKETPHQKLEDLAVVARFRITEDSSTLVTDAVASYLRMTDEEIMETARANSDKNGYTFENINDILTDYMRASGCGKEYTDEFMSVEDPLEMYVMSNSSRYQGAAAIASTEMLEYASKKIGGNYYVLPSSCHEVILLPEKEGIEKGYLEELVKTANAEYVPIEIQLSDHIYFYDAEERTLTMCGGEEKEQENDNSKEKDLEETYGRGR